MKYIINQVSILLLLVFVFTACQPEIDEYYYSENEPYVDTDVLSLLKEDSSYSKFLQLIEDVDGDSILNNGNVFTLFVPKNEAFENLSPSVSKKDLFNYLVTESYININQIGQSSMLQSYGGKFVKFNVLGDTSFLYDGVEVLKGSPLTNNGRFYTLADIVNPCPNIYEYFTQTNPFFNSYFLAQDSVAIDLELSTPLYYNDDGQTVYDTVLIVINKFEEEYFEISEEFRARKATMLVFSQQQYDDALNQVYDELGIDSIPLAWQNDVLMPYVLDHGVFRNAVDYSSLLQGRVKNIKGDSVDIDPDIIDRNFYDCSNGRVYNYKEGEFKIPEELYKVSDTIFLVDRLYKRGTNLYDWGDEFEVTGTNFPPQVSNTNSLIVDMLDRNYSGVFSLSYKHYNVFPGNYRLKFKVNIVGSIGVWKIFVNDEEFPVKSYLGDYWGGYDLNNLRGGFISPFPSEDNPYFSVYPFEFTKGGDGKTCVFETVMMDYITDFADVDVRLEYVKPSSNTSKNAGINIEFSALEFYEGQ